MAGSTACQHEWLASRKRPTWDYCPKCGATRNRQLLEQGAAETDAAQPVTVEPVAVMVEPVAEAPEHPLDDADRAIEPAVVAPPPTTIADASTAADGPSVEPDDGAATLAPMAAAAHVGVPSGTPTDTDAEPSPPWVNPPTPAWTTAPRDVAPQEPIAFATTTLAPTPSPPAVDEAAAPPAGPSWPTPTAPVLANPPGVVAPSTWQAQPPTTPKEPRGGTVTTSVGPRITRPEPVGTAFVVAAPSMTTQEERGSSLRRLVLWAVLIGVGVVIGFFIAGVTRGARPDAIVPALGAAGAGGVAPSVAALVSTPVPTGGGPAPTLPLTSGPVMAPAAASLGQRLTSGGMEVILAWDQPTDGSRASRYDLRMAVDGGSARAVKLARATSTSAKVSALVDRDYGLRLRARDGDGTPGAYAESAFHIVRVEDSADGVRASSGWTVAKHPAYSGTARYATKPGATLSVAFDGSAVAVVGPRGPGRGRADVIVDGERVARIDARASTFQPVELLAVVDGLAAGPHVLSVRVVRTPDRQMVAIDRFLVLSQP